MKRDPFLKHPVIAPTTIGLVDRPAALTALRQVAHQIAYIFAVGTFAVSRHREHRRPALFLDPFTRLVSGKPGIPCDDLTDRV